MAKQTEPQETNETYSVGEVATQTDQAPIENKSNKPISSIELLVRIANDVEKIKNNVVNE